MKHLLVVRFCVILTTLISLATTISAQDTRFAYVTKERDRIFIKEGDQMDTLFNPVPAQKFRAERLAVLGSTKDGKALLVGGKIFFAAFGSGVQDSVVGFFKIPIPFNPASFLSEAKILHRVTENAAKILPLGTLTPDDQEWFGIWQSGGAGGSDFTIYHGKFDGTGNVVTQKFPVNEDRLQNGYHLSNLTTSVDGKTLFFIAVDKLTSNPTAVNRYRLVRWTPTHLQTQFVIGGDFGSSVYNLLGGTTDHPSDEAFAFAIRSVQGADGLPRVHMALANEPNNQTITVYEIATQGGGLPKFNTPIASFSRSALPAGLDFFTGYTGNADDVYSEAPQQGNGGDMMFSRDGTKMIFVVHEDPENILIRNESSAIYQYDFSSGTMTELHNDILRQERQPIFVDGTGVVIEEPGVRGYVELSAQNFALGNIGVGKDTTFRITITNPSDSVVQVDAVAIVQILPGYEIVANEKGLSAPYSFELAQEQSTWFDVKFAPTGVGQYNGGFTVQFETDSTRAAFLSGSGVVVDVEAVQRSHKELFNLNIAPNPMRGNSTVTLTGVEPSEYRLRLMDVSGKVIHEQTGRFQSGERVSIGLNGESLGLSAGSYILSIEADGVQATRQIVVVE